MHTDNYPEDLIKNILDDTGKTTFYPYICTQCMISHEDFGTVQSYGILKMGGCETEQVHYPDISTAEDRVRRLVNLMNELQIDVVHMQDVIEDFLTDPSAFDE